MIIRYSGYDINDDYCELEFETDGNKFLELVPSKQYFGNYLNINKQGESIYIKEESLNIEMIIGRI